MTNAPPNISGGHVLLPTFIQMEFPMNTKGIPASAQETDSHIPSTVPIFQAVATPGALALMNKYHIEPLDLLRRHLQGDCNYVDKHDRATNLAALKNGGRLVSSYEIGFQKLWLMTEAVGETGVTRASTCFMQIKEF